VSQVPTCFKNFHEPGPFQDYLEDAIRFVSEPANLPPTDSQSAASFKPHLSPYLLEQVKTQACRGAIRFGEPLNRLACAQMIHTLQECKQSFRCAHGRVLVKPVCFLPPHEEQKQTIQPERTENPDIIEFYKHLAQVKMVFQKRKC